MSVPFPTRAVISRACSLVLFAHPRRNLFRLCGDLSHLASIFILLHKIIKSRSCRGISFKTQLIYLIVFCTRCVPALQRVPHHSRGIIVTVEVGQGEGTGGGANE